MKSKEVEQRALEIFHNKGIEVKSVNNRETIIFFSLNTKTIDDVPSWLHIDSVTDNIHLSVFHTDYDTALRSCEICGQPSVSENRCSIHKI